MKRLVQCALTLILAIQVSGGAQALPLLACPLFDADRCCPAKKPIRCQGEACWSATKTAPTPADVPPFALVEPPALSSDPLWLAAWAAPAVSNTPWLHGREIYLRTRVLLI